MQKMGVNFKRNQQWMQIPCRINICSKRHWEKIHIIWKEFFKISNLSVTGKWCSYENLISPNYQWNLVLEKMVTEAQKNGVRWVTTETEGLPTSVQSTWGRNDKRHMEVHSLAYMWCCTYVWHRSWRPWVNIILLLNIKHPNFMYKYQMMRW